MKKIIITVLVVTAMIIFLNSGGFIHLSGLKSSVLTLSNISNSTQSNTPILKLSCSGSLPAHSKIVADMGTRSRPWQYAVDKDVTRTVNGITLTLISKQDTCTFKCEDNYEYNQDSNTCDQGLSASITANGVNNLTVLPGTKVTYAWSSNKAKNASSTYTTNKSSCGPGGVWIANTLSGSTTVTIPTSYVGCVITITYTVKDISNKVATGTLIVTVPSVKNT